MTRISPAAIGRELGKANVVEIEPAVVSEDFGRFGDGGKIPTVMLAHGASVDIDRYQRGLRPSQV